MPFALMHTPTISSQLRFVLDFFFRLRTLTADLYTQYNPQHQLPKTNSATDTMNKKSLSK